MIQNCNIIHINFHNKLTSIKFNYQNENNTGWQCNSSEGDENSQIKISRADNETREKLYSMKDIYFLIEFPKICLNNLPSHLYPTDRIISIYSQYRKNKSSLLFNEFIEKYYSKQISISTETTQYLPEKFLKKAKQLSVKNKKLIRNETELDTKKNIFILDKDFQLFVTHKKKEAQHGRIQHSSLSNGNPVLAAGTIQSSYCYYNNNKIIKYQISNKSGHYRPDNKCLEIVLNWFNLNNFNYKIVGDTTKEAAGYSNGIREISFINID